MGRYEAIRPRQKFEPGEIGTVVSDLSVDSQSTQSIEARACVGVYGGFAFLCIRMAVGERECDRIG